jgi:hypothetical protein
MLGQIRADGAGDDIVAAARRIGNDTGDSLRGVEFSGEFTNVPVAKAPMERPEILIKSRRVEHIFPPLLQSSFVFIASSLISYTVGQIT